jgi:hypothetical protein
MKSSGWARCSDVAERFAALLLSGVLAERLRELSDVHLGRVLDREVCSNLSVLGPELTVCMAAAERLCRRAVKLTLRRRSGSLQNEGDHILHAEAELYRARIPHFLLPFEKDKFASNTFVVPSLLEAKDCLWAGFRATSRYPALLCNGKDPNPV